MPNAHADIPVWNSENWFYEDWEVGHQIRSLRRTISEGESMNFNALVTDMHPYVADDIFALAEPIGPGRGITGFVGDSAYDLAVGASTLGPGLIQSFSVPNGYISGAASFFIESVNDVEVDSPRPQAWVDFLSQIRTTFLASDEQAKATLDFIDKMMFRQHQRRPYSSKHTVI